jgi:hypothetical protein
MLRLKLLFNQLLPYASSLGFLLCAGVYFAWDYIVKLFPNLSEKTLTGLLLTCMYGFMLFVSRRLDTISASIGDHSHASLGQAITDALFREPRIEKLSVIAVEASLKHAAECHVILPYFANASPHSHEGLNNMRVDHFVKEWLSLSSKGRVGRLYIYTVAYWPSLYACIVDDRILISGLYTHKPQSVGSGHLVVDYGEPFIIRKGAPHNDEMLRKYATWFGDIATHSTRLHEPDAVTH